MEYSDGGNLSEYLQASGRLGEAAIQHIYAQLGNPQRLGRVNHRVFRAVLRRNVMERRHFFESYQYVTEYGPGLTPSPPCSVVFRAVGQRYGDGNGKRYGMGAEIYGISGTGRHAYIHACPVVSHAEALYSVARFDTFDMWRHL